VERNMGKSNGTAVEFEVHFTSKGEKETIRVNGISCFLAFVLL
jgi:hypothetical protein